MRKASAGSGFGPTTEALDATVSAAYGWSAAICRTDEVRRQALALNGGGVSESQCGAVRGWLGRPFGFPLGKW